MESVRNRRTFFGLSLLFVGGWIGAVFCSCSPPEPVRIGFLAGLSGPVADSGISARDAIQMIVEQCNENGGIHGRRIELVIEDDRQDPDTARKAAERLIGQGVAAVVGPMTSGIAMAVVPIFNEAGVLTVSPTVTTEALSGRDDHFFRVTSTTGEFAAKSANYQIRTGDMRRITVAYDLGNRSFSENWLGHFRTIFTDRGGVVAAAVGFQSGAGQPFLNLARKLLAPDPDGVLIIANSMDSAMLCQQIRKVDGRLRITLSDWGGTERLLELGGRAVEGVTVVQTFDRESPAPRYREFRAAYMKRFQREPGFPGVNTHDAIAVVLATLQARKDGQDLKAALLSKRRFSGLQSDFTFDDFGDVKRHHASISIVRDGKFVVVE